MKRLHFDARLRASFACSALACVALAGAPASAQDLLNDTISFAGFDLALRPYATFPSSNNNLVYSTTRRGDDRLYVTTEEGKIYTLESGASGTAAPVEWFNVGSAVQAVTGSGLFGNSSQRGLQSVAFHPDFETPGADGYGKLYTTYLTSRPFLPPAQNYLGDSGYGGHGADSVLAEWTYNHNTGEVVTQSHRELFRVSMPLLDHPIKQAAFNPYSQPGDEDYGLLYLTHGDSNIKHSPDDDPLDLGNALGKMLRIDPLESGGDSYTIPAGNPFADSNDSGVLKEVYAYGFRNPHTFSFNRDPSGDTQILVGDIGRNNIEEVNLVLPGASYGWTEREGTFIHDQAADNSGGEGYLTGVSPLPANEATLGYTYPVAQYDHDAPVGVRSSSNAVASGFVIENARDESLNGLFLFADFASRTSGAASREGEVFYSSFDEMLGAVTQLDAGDPSRDEPSELTQAVVGKLRLELDHDNNPGTAPQLFDGMIDLLGASRSDVRFARGPHGELYLTSKQGGRVYLATDTVPLEGDYNGDGQVDAADYTLWRDTLGDFTANGADADGDGDGIVGAGDLAVWSDHYGQGLSGGAASAVPEPSALLLTLATGAVAPARRRRPVSSHS